MKKIVAGIHETRALFSRLVKWAIGACDGGVEGRKPGLLAGRLTIKPGLDDAPAGFDEAFDV